MQNNKINPTYYTFIYLFTPLIMLILLTLLIIYIINPVDEITIQCYRTDCYEKIYSNINVANVRNVLVTFGQADVLMEKSFYVLRTTNTGFIEEFLTNIEWCKVIIENNFNKEGIENIILSKYNEWIAQIENDYDNFLVSRGKLMDAQSDMKYALHENIQQYTLSKKEKTYAVYLIEEFSQTINWNEYVRTEEVRLKTFFTAKRFFYLYFEEKINIFTDNAIIPTKGIEFITRVKNTIILKILFSGLKKFSHTIDVRAMLFKSILEGLNPNSPMGKNLVKNFINALDIISEASKTTYVYAIMKPSIKLLIDEIFKRFIFM